MPSHFTCSYSIFRSHQIEFEEKKKSEGKKARDDKDKVMDMLFAAFEKHQYYNIKDLVKITNQPVVCQSLNVICFLSLLPDRQGLPMMNGWLARWFLRCALSLI